MSANARVLLVLGVLASANVVIWAVRQVEAHLWVNDVIRSLGA